MTRIARQPQGALDAAMVYGTNQTYWGITVGWEAAIGFVLKRSADAFVRGADKEAMLLRKLSEAMKEVAADKRDDAVRHQPERQASTEYLDKLDQQLKLDQWSEA